MSPASASRYRDFAARLLEYDGALVETLDPEGLEAMLPAPVQHTLHAPEFVRLSFGAELPPEAQRVSLESEWLDRLGQLLGERGRWLQRVVHVPVPTLSHPERIVEHGLVLQNAIYRLARVTPAWTRCLILLLRYTAISDDKRTGIIKFGLNLANGSALDPFVDDVFNGAWSATWSACMPTTRACVRKRGSGCTNSIRTRRVSACALRQPRGSIRRRWLTYARNTICASPSSWSKLSSSQALCSASN